LPMPFIHPWMLAGTAAGSAPVIIHLLNRQRYRRITWAAMHWLLASFKKSSRRLQIEDLILLIMRILILVLLALALARPFLQESGLLGGRSHVHRVVVMDTSFSMGYTAGGKTAFDRAKEAARALSTTSTLSAGDAVTLIFMSDQANARIKASTNLSEVYREVDTAELSHAGSDPVKALAAAFGLLDESDHPRKEIFLVTDMTRNGWLDTAAAAARVRGAEDLRKALDKFLRARPDRRTPPVYLLDVGVKDAQNLAVTGLEPDVNVVAAKSRVIFKVEVSNFSDKERLQLPVTFKVDGERVSSELVDVKSGGGRATAMFSHQFEVPGAHWVTAAIEADSLALDDARHLAVPVVPSLKVLAVDGEEKPDWQESETGLLSRALSIPVSERMAAEGINSPSIISTRVVPDSELKDVQFEGSDLVVLANVPVIPEERLAALRKFVQEGGGLMIFVGDGVGADLYNDRLYDAKDPKGGALPPMLPCRLVEPEGEAGNPDAQKFFAFDPDDSLAEVMPVFAKQERRSYIARPDRKSPEIGVRVFRRYKVKLEEPAPGPAKPAAEAGTPGAPGAPGAVPPKEPPARPEPAATPAGGEAAGKAPEAAPRGRVYVPLKYDDGDHPPAVLIREYGLGKVCLFTTTADTHWCDLANKWVLVPLAHDLVYHLVRERGRKHNVPVGGAFSVRWPDEDLLKDVTVQPPEGHEDDKRTIKPETVNNVTVLNYDSARWAGPYRLKISGEDDLREIFAAVLDPTESDLAAIDLKEVEKLLDLKDLRFEKIENQEKIAETLKGKTSGREFWRNLAWTVLTLAVLETFLAWFFGRNRW